MDMKQKTVMLRNGIIHQDDSPNKAKLNLISGAFTPPFADAVWVLSDYDRQTVKRMTDMFTSLYEQSRDDEALSLLLVICGLLGQIAPPYITDIASDKDCLHYFVYQFIMDLDEVFAEAIGK